MFQVIFSHTQALKKDIKHLKKSPQEGLKIKKSLDELLQDPINPSVNIKLLQPKSNERYRLRVGKWRIIYSLDVSNKIILVHRVGLRKDIYK